MAKKLVKSKKSPAAASKISRAAAAKSAPVRATALDGTRILKIKKIEQKWLGGINKPRAEAETEDSVWVYNEFDDTTDLEDVSTEPYQMEDGDIILANEPLPDGSIVEEVVVSAYIEGENGQPDVEVAEVMTYDSSNADESVEVDMSYFESFEEYYDENDDQVYESSDCGTSIGIRG